MYNGKTDELDMVLLGGDSCKCPIPGSCTNKTGTQCVEVSAPVHLTPTAVVGTPTVTCQGSPSVTCETDTEGATCTVVLKQKVCVAIPVQYGVTLTKDDPTIACGGPTCTC